MTTQPTGPHPPRVPLLYWILAGIAGIVVTSLLGGALLSGLVTGDGWAWPDSVIRTFAAWWRTPGDPAAAWTTDPRPGPAWLVYTFAAMIAVAECALWFWCAVQWGGRNRYTGGLARTRDVAGILDEAGAKEAALKLRPSLKGTKARRIPADELVATLGTNVADGKPIAILPRDSLAVFGGSGQGKSWRVAVRLILSAPGFAVVTSTKSDLLKATYWTRRRKGRIAVFDPEDITGWPERVRWSVIAGCDDPDTAKRRAAGLVAARPLGKGEGGDASAFYAGRAATVLRCYLYAAAVAGKTLVDVRRWSKQTRCVEVSAILDRHLPDWGRDFQQVTASGDPKTDGNTMSTVASILEPLSSPNLMAAVDVSATDSLDLAEFVSGPNTLYLASEGDAESVAPFVAAMANEIHHLARHMSNRAPGGRLDPPMRLVLDEVANVAPIPNLPAKMTDSGGRAIQLIVFIHNMDQLRKRFGEVDAAQLVKSASARLILPGLLAHDVLEDVSRLLGEQEAWRTVETGRHDWRSQPYDRRIMRPEEIRQMVEGHALLLYRNQPGLKLRLRAHWEDDKQARVVEPSMAYCEHAIASGRLPAIATGVRPVGSAPATDAYSSTAVLDEFLGKELR